MDFSVTGDKEMAIKSIELAIRGVEYNGVKGFSGESLMKLAKDIYSFINNPEGVSNDL